MRPIRYLLGALLVLPLLAFVAKLGMVLWSGRVDFSDPIHSGDLMIWVIGTLFLAFVTYYFFFTNSKTARLTDLVLIGATAALATIYGNGIMVKLGVIAPPPIIVAAPPPTAPFVPPKGPTLSEVITPESTAYMNSGHVNQVDQPVQKIKDATTPGDQPAAQNQTPTNLAPTSAN